MAEEKKHSARFETVLYWFRKKYWSAARVVTAVGKWITEEEKNEILEEEK